MLAGRRPVITTPLAPGFLLLSFGTYVVGGNDGSGEAVTAIQTDTVAAGRAVDLDLARVGLEVLGRILCAIDSQQLYK